MTNPTTYFSWQMPTATDLVTDLPADFEVFGQAVDTDFQGLLGGTTGQVLSKTSGTDLAFTWVTTDDTNAIQNAIMDAKGDLIGASAADTPARLAVGANGTVLTADSSETTGLKWDTAASGGWTSLGSGSLTSNILTLSSISGAYKDLRLCIKNLQVVTAVDVILNVNSSTNIDAVQLRAITNTASTNAVTAGADYYLNNNSVSTGNNNNIMILDFLNYAETSGFKIFRYNARLLGNSNSNQFMASGAVLTSSAITEIVVKTAGANFNGGTYEIWGIQ